jgi:ADP-heptose:LPS heptosyltransferase
VINWINFLFNKRIERLAAQETMLSAPEIDNASKVLFSVFERYGDSIIAFKVIKEFIDRYPDKKYVLITTDQAFPYAERILAPSTVEMYHINKRKNLIRLWTLISTLRNNPVDIGFNPLSNGSDSKFFVTFARKFSFYDVFFLKKAAQRGNRALNFYNRVREYLLLPERIICCDGAKIAGGKNVLICPFSTDKKKNLDVPSLKKLCAQIHKSYLQAQITIALPAGENYRDLRELEFRRFIFKKNLATSKDFLTLLEGVDLFFGVDSGPLHLATALGIPSIGIFGPGAPEIVIDSGSKIVPIRNKKMKGYFCGIKECEDPICIYPLFNEDIFTHRVELDFMLPIRYESDRCPMLL